VVAEIAGSTPLILKPAIRHDAEVVPSSQTIFLNVVRFQVLTAAIMKMAVFWVVAPWMKEAPLKRR
jgi:hypothetical protein